MVVPEEITKREEMDNQDVEWVGRLGVAYMEDTGKYALFVQHECADGIFLTFSLPFGKVSHRFPGKVSAVLLQIFQ